jgi:cysteine sulfinate desulfinase/cysteine desulfurase-like protein
VILVCLVFLALLAIGVPEGLARGALRLSLGQGTTWDALEYTLETLCRVVRDLRGLAAA